MKEIISKIISWLVIIIVLIFLTPITLIFFHMTPMQIIKKAAKETD